MRIAGIVALVLLWLPHPARGQAQPDGGVPAEVVVEIRVHGNHTTPDADVLRDAGVEVGQVMTATLRQEVAARLEATGRFRSVEVRKRYRSIVDTSQVVLVIVTEEKTGVTIDVPSPGPMRQLASSLMWLPVVRYEDGYGLTYGARFSFVDLVGSGSRLSVPLTWGGERQAALEYEQTFSKGPVTRLEGWTGLWRRENPAYDEGDLRKGAGLKVERAFTPWLRVGASGQFADVSFGALRDNVGSAGVEAQFDTRLDRTFPRNAVHGSVAWERLWFDESPDTQRVRIEAGGGLSLPWRTVLVLRAQRVWAADTLPPYEEALFGGEQSLRGFPLGFRTGDRLAAGSVEWRIPLSSPMGVGRVGLAVFADVGVTYDVGESLGDADVDRGAGAGFFVALAAFSMRVDVARGLDSGTRAHVMFGLRAR